MVRSPLRYRLATIAVTAMNGAFWCVLLWEGQRGSAQIAGAAMGCGIGMWLSQHPNQGTARALLMAPLMVVALLLVLPTATRWDSRGLTAISVGGFVSAWWGLWELQHWHLRARPVRGENECWQCGYDLRRTADAEGVKFEVCPECGARNEGRFSW